MIRPFSEIMEDVYYKKLVIVLQRLMVPKTSFEEVMNRMDKLALAMARRTPEHKERIEECVKALADLINDVFDNDPELIKMNNKI